jgi:hypothetical protein
MALHGQTHGGYAQKYLATRMKGGAIRLGFVTQGGQDTAGLAQQSITAPLLYS